MRADGVLEKRIALSVRLVALGTLERLLAGVKADMPVQIGFLNESFLAMRTTVWTLAGVRLFVPHERGLSHEWLLANGTLPQINAAIAVILNNAASDGARGAALLQKSRGIKADLCADGRLLWLLRVDRRNRGSGRG